MKIEFNSFYNCVNLQNIDVTRVFKPFNINLYSYSDKTDSNINIICADTYTSIWSNSQTTINKEKIISQSKYKFRQFINSNKINAQIIDVIKILKRLQKHIPFISIIANHLLNKYNITEENYQKYIDLESKLKD